MAGYESLEHVRGENPAALSASLLSRKGAASPEGFAETALPEIGLNVPDDWPRAERSSPARRGWGLPLVLGVALLIGFVMLTWLVFGTGDGGGHAVAIPNLAPPPAPSQSFAPASRPRAEALEAPEISETKAPGVRGASAGPDPIDAAVLPPGSGPLPSSPAGAQDRAAGPATAPIVETVAPGKARRERPGEAAGGAGGGGYRVQLHALSSDAAVRREWPRLQKTHGDLLRGLSLKVVRTGSGPRQKSFYRMQVGTLASAAAAKKLCDRLKRRKLDCVIVRP